MLEFLLGLAIGLTISTADTKPVPYQTITYSDSGRVVRCTIHQHLNIVICLIRMLLVGIQTIFATGKQKILYSQYTQKVL